MQSVNRHVSLLFRMGERYLNRQLRGTGVSSGTGILLIELRDGGPRHFAGLAAAVGADKSHITRSIRALQGAGLVSVSPGPSDRRTLVVSITESGQLAAGQVEAAILSWLAVVTRGVTPQDLATVDAVMNDFYANAVAYFAEADLGVDIEG